MRLPYEIQSSLDNYALAGIPTGDFLRACLENKFIEAVCRADNTNTLYLKDIAQYIYSDMPPDCHGSPAIVRAWIVSKRPALKTPEVPA